MPRQQSRECHSLLALHSVLSSLARHTHSLTHSLFSTCIIHGRPSAQDQDLFGQQVRAALGLRATRCDRWLTQCGRLCKEVASYQSEITKQQEVVARLTADGTTSESDIRQQQQVLEESQLMLPDTLRRLQAAVDDLQSCLVCSPTQYKSSLLVWVMR
jgi:peptidoglycan hydrolase CwlO-like protein